MLPYPALQNLYELVSVLERRQIPGALVECGAYNAGSAGLLGRAARTEARHLWVFDSWEGMPEPSLVDGTVDGVPLRKGMSRGREDIVRRLLFDRLRLPRDTTHLVRGWFADSLRASRTEIGTIALLHLDCDFYEPVKCCLEELYDSVAAGGVVVVDDYGCYIGAKLALDQFIAGRRLSAELCLVPRCSAVYFWKR